MLIVLATISGLSLLFWLTMGFYWWRASRRIEPLEKAAAPVPEYWPRVSVVVPACNEAATLEEAFGSLLRTTYPNVELIGTRQGKIVLAQYRGPADPDTGGAFTIKRYSSEKQASGQGEWRHTRVVLSPTNPEYRPIILGPEDAGQVKVVAAFVSVLRSSG